jgi:hypothetical protein
MPMRQVHLNERTPLDSAASALGGVRHRALLVGYPGGIIASAGKRRNADFIEISVAVRSVP